MPVIAQHGMAAHLPNHCEPGLSWLCSWQVLDRLGEEFLVVAVKRAGPHASREQAYSEMTGFFPKCLSVFYVCLLKQKNILCINTALQPFQKYWPGLCLSICGLVERMSLASFLSVCAHITPATCLGPSLLPTFLSGLDAKICLFCPMLTVFSFLVLSVRQDPSVVSAMMWQLDFGQC